MTETNAADPGEPHYRKLIEVLRQQGVERLGLMTGWAWYDDPRHLLFTLSRYKFVAKMMAGRNNILEVGCSDGFATRLVAQSVKSVVGVDFDPQFIADAMERKSDRWPIDFRVHDILTAPVPGGFDGAYALDVIEHILPEREDRELDLVPARRQLLAAVPHIGLEAGRQAAELLGGIGQPYPRQHRLQCSVTRGRTRPGGRPGPGPRSPGAS